MRNLILLLLLLVHGWACSATDEHDPIPWQSVLDEKTFQQAAAQNKFVLLNLEAVWCHWCHVMDAKTYSNEAVQNVLAQHYVTVKIDHDARPDLAQRYRRWGWPATIVFSADGTEIVKRAGYMAPDNFERLLNTIVRDPSPERLERQSGFELAASPLLDKNTRTTLRQKRLSSYDRDKGGLRGVQKYLDSDSVEYNLVLAGQSDLDAAQKAQQTLDAALSLIDPVWGGAYQYSTFGNWDNPHYEKIMLTQARYIRIYAHAYAQFGDSRYLEAAESISGYLTRFLKDKNGGFYNSQDADLIQGQKSHEYFQLDDAGRVALGIPRIDTNIYAQENGWIIEALATLYEASGKESVLNEAIIAAKWITANRSLETRGGFAHGEKDQGGPYLGDTLAMGRAFLQLYRTTAERYWLTKATAAADFIEDTFAQPDAGFVSAVATTGPVKPVVHLDENISATRFFNLLHHYSGKQNHRRMAEHGMRYIATPAVATRRVDESGILLADLEIANDPAHYTVIGLKDHETSADLYDLALQQSGWYKRVEWWDLDEGPLENPDIEYPVFDKPAGYVCVNGRCSLPSFEADRYARIIEQLSKALEQI